MNDQRLVPPSAGPSDEEIGLFIGEFYTHDEWTSREVDADFTMALVRAALARWGAQTEYDAEKVERLISFIENGMSAYAIETSQSPEWDQELLRRAMELRSSRRPVARTKYDAVKVEALLDYLEAGIDGIWPGRHTTQLAAAVRSSRRPKGRVVEGWAWFVEDEIVKITDNKVPLPKNSRQRSVPCRIEILDAPEEGSK